MSIKREGLNPSLLQSYLFGASKLLRLKIVLGLLLLGVTSLVSAQTNDTTSRNNIVRIKAFITDIADVTKRADVILSQHVLLEKTKTDEEYDYLEAAIEEIRLNLQLKDLDEIIYTPFNKLPKKDVWDVDPEGKPTESMYFLHYKNRQMLAVYLARGKIASFTLVSKGNKAHFVTY